MYLCGGKINITEDASKRYGLVCSLTVSCENCKSQKQFFTSEKCKDNELFESNIRYFYGLRCIGKGPTAGKILCGIMNLPRPTTSISKHRHILLEKVAEESMKTATQEAVEENRDSETPTDITIAFDGTWQKRGHQSLNSCAAATSIDTGKVLDVEILCKHCHGCNIAKSNADKKAQHEPKCTKNYTGSSGGMESTSAVNIFHRSLQKRGVRYVQFIGDGDSSSFKSVVDSRPYGNKIPEKLECVNHVQKRMGTRLRRRKQELSKTPLSDGKTIRGRLLDNTINQLSEYYGQAIRSNENNLDGMKKAVCATFSIKYQQMTSRSTTFVQASGVNINKLKQLEL